MTEFLAFQALVNILKNLKDGQNKPVFKVIEEFYGQYEDEEGNPLWSAPAALIEMVTIDWEDDIKNREQYGDFTFKIHVVDDTGYENINRRLFSKYPSNVKTVAKGLRHRVVELSELGINAAGILMNTISRKRTEFVNQLSENTVTILEFNSLIVDYSSLPTYSKILADFEVKYYLLDNELEFQS